MLGPEAVGQRVVVRRLLPGETGPSGGPAMTDVLGVLETSTAERLDVRKADGELVCIPRSLLVAGKPVPPRASPRLRIPAEELARITSAGWPPRTARPLGDWMLREAGGFTGRANSALIAGRPDRPVPAALRAVAAFYTQWRLPARAQVVIGSANEALLLAAGWVPSDHARPGVLVQVASVAQARRRARADGSRTPSAGVRIDAELEADWLALYGRASGVDEAVAASVLRGGGEVAFARLGTPAVAIGRAVRTDDWAGLSAVEVAPPLRRRGLGRAVVEALLDWAAERGALSAYLQVRAENEPAIELYRRYGFLTHHRYRYLEPG